MANKGLHLKKLGHFGTVSVRILSLNSRLGLQPAR
jgi:hypothetical protein